MPSFQVLRCAALVVAAAALFLLAAPAGAATYYVDAAAGSDGRDGRSRATAWRNLPGTVGAGGSGWVKLQPGDTIRIRRGSTFRQRLRVTGDWYATASASRPVSIEADTGWGSGPVTWDGSSCESPLIEIREVNGVRLDGKVEGGIVIKNAAWHGLEATGRSPQQMMQGLVLRYLRVSNTNRRGVQLFRQNDFELSWVQADGGFRANEASGICIGEGGDNGCTNGRLNYCASYHWGPKGTRQGAGTASYQGFWIVNSANLTLNYCNGYENAGRGFDIGGVAGSTRVPLSDNIVLNYCRAYNNGNDGFGSSAEDMPESSQSRHYFNYCLSYGNGNGGWQIYEGPTTCLYNCVSDQNSTALRLWGVNPGMHFRNGRKSHIRIYNCVLSRPRAASGENAAGTVFIGYVNQLDLKMDYNFYLQGASDRAVVWGYYAPGPSITYRYTEAEAPGGRSKWFLDHGCDEHSRCSIDGYQVGFVNADRRDYHLSPASDCIDAGTAAGPGLDFDGVSAPQNGVKDIGAFEFYQDSRAPRPPAPRGVRTVAE
jgi:hypothetical protein